MNHIVPDFVADADYSIPESPKKSIMSGDEDVMELLWQNGQVVMHSRNQRSVGNKKPETRPPLASREIRSSIVEEQGGPSALFMQEDEMASWLHYPADDNPLEGYLYSNDLLYPTPPSSAPLTTAHCSLPPPPPPSIMIPARPPIPSIRRVEAESGLSKYPNLLHLSRPNKCRSPESGPSNSNTLPGELRPSTVVASNETPAAEAPESRASHVMDKQTTVAVANTRCGGSTSGVGALGTSSGGREIETGELSGISSPGSGGSGGSGSVEPSCENPPPPTDDRKRKGRDTDDIECHSEDAEFEYPDAKKQSHGSTSSKRSRAAEVHNLSERDAEFEYPDAKKQSHGSTSSKRSRAAEVHNLSERRRRDRINEKMKALQELIPRCNKSDKASMLDEAIEYLKSLQMQVQMMSMGCSMVPVMFPGVQQYMPQMAMGMGMGMNHVMVPYPAILPGSSLPNPVATQGTHLGPRFPVPAFNIPPATTMGPTTSQAANMSAPMMSSFPLHNQNQPQVPNFTDPFQQYAGLHQTPLSLPQQNQVGMPPIAAKPSTSKDPINPAHHHTETG